MANTPQTTDLHAKLFVYQLQRKHAANSSEKLAGTLLDAKVDLNPHQVEAALFAFKSPLSKGAILADEVGLGKTIEAGLLLSQRWSEGKRKILIATLATFFWQCSVRTTYRPTLTPLKLSDNLSPLAVLKTCLQYLKKKEIERRPESLTPLAHPDVPPLKYRVFSENLPHHLGAERCARAVSPKNRSLG